MLVFCLLLLACTERPQATSIDVAVSAQNVGLPSDLKRPLRHERLEGQPIAEMLPQLHPDNQERLLEFASTVPDPLPELAYPSSVYLRPEISHEKADRLLLDINNGEVKLNISVANPGTRVNQPNVICLRNQLQVSCTPEVDVWDVWLQPKTLAMIPVQIAAQPGDQLTFLLVPPDEYKRYFVASQLLYAFAENYPERPQTFVTLEAAVQPVAEGCDINLLLPDAADTELIYLPTYHLLGSPVPLQLLIKLCQPEKPFFVYLVAFVDRERVVRLPGDVWQQPVKLGHEAMIVPIDTALFGAVKTAQIAFVPHGSTLEDYTLDSFKYSFEMLLPPPRRQQ